MWVYPNTYSLALHRTYYTGGPLLQLCHVASRACFLHKLLSADSLPLPVLAELLILRDDLPETHASPLPVQWTYSGWDLLKYGAREKCSSCPCFHFASVTCSGNNSAKQPTAASIRNKWCWFCCRLPSCAVSAVHHVTAAVSDWLQKSHDYK